MIDLYKGITEDIFKNLSSDDVNEEFISIKVKERQRILDSLTKEELKVFKQEYLRNEIDLLDKEIKQKLAIELIKAKKELVDHKTSNSVNKTYTNMKKNNLNIFSKKV